MNSSQKHPMKREQIEGIATSFLCHSTGANNWKRIECSCSLFIDEANLSNLPRKITPMALSLVKVYENSFNLSYVPN